ncbi:hypothetical protein ACC771_18260, partial [Rhizobium ruizarguesonis]
FVRIDRQPRQHLLDEEIMKDGFDGKTVLINAAHATFSLATTLMLPLCPAFIHSQFCNNSKDLCLHGNYARRHAHRQPVLRLHRYRFDST